MFIDAAAFEQVRLAARIRPLVPFIGAGMSQLAGCPGWDEFANKALRFFVTGTHRKLSHAELHLLQDLPARVKLALALDLQDASARIDFVELLRSGNADREKRGEQLYEKLGTIASTFVTTNYDDKLDTGTREIFYRREELTAENLLSAKSAVFHIHGSMRDPDGMVRTTDEYLTRYANHDLARGTDGENPFLFFLNTLFAARTVLFIGYSLSELEVLEYVLQKRGAPTQQHFMLQGFFSHQRPLVDSLKGYYKRFHVTLLPFSRDTNDWDELALVIEELARQLPMQPRLDLSKLQEMEDLLK